MSYLHLDVDKIYIVNYIENVDRRAYIADYLSKYDNIIEFCSFPNRVELTSDLIHKYYDTDTNKLRMRSDVYGREYFATMMPSEIATAICHYIIFKKSLSEISDRCLILEDDVIFNDNFTNFNNFLTDTPSDFDCIFIGDGAKLHAENVESGKTAYLRTSSVTRCTDSIVYTKKLLDNIVSAYHKFTQPIDWEMELILRELNARVYWWEPTLVSQGSQTGVYRSNIR